MSKVEYFEAVYGRCPCCNKTIERIGVFRKDKRLLGFIGVQCPYCNLVEAPDLNNIERPEKQPDATPKKKKGLGAVIRPKAIKDASTV